MTLRLRALPAILLALVVGGLAMSAAPGPAAPAARVVDGDTVEVDGETVQLYGIDAPELGQLCDSDGYLWPCGVEAALALRKLVTFGGHKLTCSPWGNRTDQGAASKRAAKLCKIGHEDVAQVMLHNGYALALPSSFPDYLDAQDQARRARLGVWHSRFAMPWHWRAASGGADRDCNVKGIVGANGLRTYAVPTDPDYREITVAADRGERLFCSDEEARAAGWTHQAEPSGTQ